MNSNPTQCPEPLPHHPQAALTKNTATKDFSVIGKLGMGKGFALKAQANRRALASLRSTTETRTEPSNE